MLNDYIYTIIEKSLGFEILPGQKKALEKLAKFVDLSSNESEIFMLKGYAGTGKTTIIGGLVKAFDDLKIKSVLLAPTGRAAKVLSSYSGKPAYTIHKKIYRQKSSVDGFGKFSIDANLHTNTIFIVDEASMISNSGYDNSVFGSGKLLDDLILYVYNNKKCKLILSGDTAQLPPVGLNVSPALDSKFLEQYDKKIIKIELTEVVRQTKDSGILFNATKLRNIIQKESKKSTHKEILNYPEIYLKNFTDIRRITGSELIESISESYDKYSEKGVAIICRSNKRANRYNEGIRRSILYKEDEISVGDLLMIVKNNYFWASDVPDMEFIANGDTAEITKIYRYTERYGYRYADVRLCFQDYNEVEIDTKILIDTLHSETASLTSEQNKELFFRIAEDFAEEKLKKKKFDNIKEHPFFNALQVKFAYAITCHKAQGGQWEKVFVDQGWLPENSIDVEYLRWLYTAFTRSSSKLDLVNFNDDFFVKNS